MDNIYNKAQFESPKHLHQTTFETLKYLQQTIFLVKSGAIPAVEANDFWNE
jgi:hypothetical protein